MEHVVDFYEDSEGNAPVEIFLESLTPKQRGKVLALIQELKKEGTNLPFPYSSQVQGKLRELRTQFGKTKLRVLYYADANQEFQLLHGVVKDTPKLEQSDINTSLENMEFHAQRLKAKEKAKKSETRSKGKANG